MYKLNTKRNFIAQHYLTVPNCGKENDLHSHHFRVEVALSGETLNGDGYLIDLIDLEQALEPLVERYRDATLNDLPEFDGLNPSIEHFSRIFWRKITERLPNEPFGTVTVRIWEDEDTWASYSE